MTRVGVCLFLFWLTVPAVGDESPMAGFVVSMNGVWLTGERTLSLGEVVGGGAFIEAALEEGNRDAHIAVLMLDGKQVFERSCALHGAARCTLQIPIDKASSSPLYKRIADAATQLFSRREWPDAEVYTRFGPDVREAVLETSNRSVAQRLLPADLTYDVAYLNLATSETSSNVDPGVPGLYEVTVSPGNRRFAKKAWVLVCNSAEFEAAEAQFQRLQTEAENWPIAWDTRQDVRRLLQAFLLSASPFCGVGAVTDSDAVQ